MAQEHIYESSEIEFDAENRSLSDAKMLDIRFEEEEDELTRKIKAIPILPRIPKIKKSNNLHDEESTTKILEHRSVLHRKEFFMNTEDTLKWPSSDTSTYDRHRNRTFNHNSDKRLNKGPTLQLGKKDSLPFNNSNGKLINGKNRTSCLTAEEKFDQLKSGINPILEVSNSIPSNSTNHLDISKDIDHFENSSVNDTSYKDVKPYKTLEERRQERIRKGLLQSSVSDTSGSTCAKNLTIIGDDKQMPGKGINENPSKGASAVECSSESSDSHTEVVDMDIANSPCEITNGDSSSAKMKSRKVTFNCPETNESFKMNSSSKKDSKKKSEHHSKKNNCQDLVVSIMKEFLKPFYSKQKISKDEYKEIMRKVVPKFSKNKKELVRKEKIEQYAEKCMKILLNKKSNTC